ncbi:MAG: ATP-binding cassette domain-containing protein [Deltaproteobacteria bacterium]|nr:ATP-binding cassette domain-containing protein [Deltaproteobacteria bacterium]MBN2673224.1 ATP-binding cassette domain-containing protein [Deltaproteobacteria bacterium]
MLSDVSLSIDEGEIFCIVGRSGVGKSVMIKQLVGLLHPDEGSIRFNGVEVVGMDEAGLQDIRKECGMVFQHATLFDSMSCLENVMLPILKHHALKPHKARERALMYMAEVGVEHLAEKEPATLGPGLRKLVAIARTLTMEPKAILFDEPTTGLDPLAARKFDQLVTGSLAGANMTQVVVSHDVRSIFDIANKIAMLHEGRVRFLGTPTELETSDDSVVRNFINGHPE